MGHGIFMPFSKIMKDPLCNYSPKDSGYEYEDLDNKNTNEQLLHGLLSTADISSEPTNSMCVRLCMRVCMRQHSQVVRASSW